VSRWRPCKRQEFVRRLGKLGFEGPFSGTRHQFMVFRHNRLAIPGNTFYSMPQLRMMLREVAEVIGRDITVEEWNSLR